MQHANPVDDPASPGRAPRASVLVTGLFHPLARRIASLASSEGHARALYLVATPAELASARALAAAWTTMDVWLTPTITQPPPPLGFYASAPGNPLEGIFKAAGIVPFTAPFNVTGQPAISLPVHVAAGNLPVGVQLVGAYAREDLLLRLAAQLEAARPFTHAATRSP